MRQVNYQVERWSQCCAELLSIVYEHWKEIALDQERIPLDPDSNYYKTLDEQGVLHIVTARDEGKLVGYYVSLVRTHPHYQGTLFGLVDLYFILPEYRLAHTGLELFKAMEQSLKERGVKSLISTTKAHYNLTPLFKRLDWEPVGTLFQKWIGD
jgi:L-amino acid N-acyltransferase YncA